MTRTTSLAHILSRLLPVLVFAIAGLSGSLAVGADPPGAVRGTIYDADFDISLPRARVSLVEIGLTVTSTDEGTFVVENVPAGAHTVSISKGGYERKVIPGVVVTPGAVKDLGRIDLASEVIEMEELVVTGENLLADTELGLLDIRADSNVVQDAVSSEMIAKAGVSDVSGALKLVVGASVHEGKYATVRGLSDRYTGTTLNGVRVPSADPRRRAVQVDLFPTSVVESVTVTKTFSPDLQGDFTGGGVDIKTKSIPGGLVLAVGGSLGHDSLATGNSDFLTYEGGGVFGDSRALPQAAAAALRSLGLKTPTDINFLPQTATPEDIAASEIYDRATASFNPTLGVGTSSPEPNTSFSATAGNMFKVGQRGIFGIVGSFTYSRGFNYFYAGRNNTAFITQSGDELGTRFVRNDTRGSDELLSGFLGTAVWAPNPEHEFSLRYIGNHAREDTSRFQFLTDSPLGFQQNQALQYTERDVSSIQAHGQHVFKNAFGYGGTFADLLFDWTLSLNATEQDQPDVRFFRNSFESAAYDPLDPGADAPPPWEWEGSANFPVGNSTDIQNTRRIWRNLQEDNKQFAMNVRLPFTQWSHSEGVVKTGLYLERSDREYTQDTFSYTLPQQAPGQSLEGNAARVCNNSKLQYTSRPGANLWTDAFLNSDRSGASPGTLIKDPDGGVWCDFLDPFHPVPFPEKSLQPDSPNQLLWVARPFPALDTDYSGLMDVGAVYAMADLPVTPRLEISMGARYETTEIQVEPFNQEFGTVWRITEKPDVDDQGNPTGGFTRFINRDFPQELARSDIDDASLLPSISVSYELMRNMRLLGAWSRTIARPTFRELAPVATEEFIDGDAFVGREDLSLSKISNFDLRWEWFRRPGEVLALSVFQKQLVDPIELISFVVENTPFIQPKTYESGRVEGVEFEFREPLDILWRGFRGLAIGLNVAMIRSEVDVLEEEKISLAPFGLATDTRRLQGQPDSLVNVNLTYDHARSGISVGVFYNATGETLITGAARGGDEGATPNVFLEPIARLDMKIAKRLGRHFSIALRGTNLTTPVWRSVFRTPYDEEVVKEERATGRAISLGAGWIW